MFLSLLAGLAAATSAHSVKWVPLSSANDLPGKPAVAPAPPAPPAAPPPPVPVATPQALPQPVAALAPPSTPDVGQRPLNLTCLGAGAAVKSSVGSVNTFSSFSGFAGGRMVSGSGFGSGTVVTQHDRNFSDQVDIRLFAGDDRIRFPRTMLPLLHGGNDGWFRLVKIIADNRAIHGEVVVNFMNHPKVYIDRVTGTISDAAA